MTKQFSMAFFTLAILCGCAPAARSQVLFQQFTYPTDAPPPGKTWWQAASLQMPELARLGVWGVWNPVPVKGGSGAQSMGYDPYDLYDLGSKNQKGTVATRFGTKADYLNYVAVAHANGLRVISDVVLNHTGGADRLQENPIMARLGMNDVPDVSKVPAQYLPEGFSAAAPHHLSWTWYAPVGADGKPGTGRFPRNYQHFHPSETHPDRNEPYHRNEFLEDYCHFADNSYVARNLERWGQWFRSQTGVDGMRLDAVKIIEPAFLDGFAKKVRQDDEQSGKIALQNNPPFFLVGEFWDTNQKLLADYQAQTHNQMKLFDFGLFYALWDMTEKPADFDMHDLLKRRLPDRTRAVSFVSNHDVDRMQPINRQKRALPYAITLAMGGQPSVFYSDYFAPEDKTLPQQMKPLIYLHNRFAVGAETVRLVDKSALVIEREKNLLACFNSGGENNAPRTLTVQTAWPANTALRVAAASANASLAPAKTDASGKVSVTVPPGGFVWLVKTSANDKTNPDRFALKPMPTTQTWEFARDLDTGEISNAPYEIPLNLAGGAAFGATLTDFAPFMKQAQIDLAAPDGQIIQSVKVERAVKCGLSVFRIPQTGTYQVRVSGASAIGTGGMTAKLKITYFAPPANLSNP